MTTQTTADRPVTGELAPVLKVLAPSTPMARMIRERVEAKQAAEAAAAVSDAGELQEA